MITLIVNGEVYGPEPRGEAEVLILVGRIARIGDVVVDIDVVEEDLEKWLRFYFDNDGDPTRLTVSSDASLSSPRTLYEQLRGCIVEHGFSLEQVLPLFTTNTARVLKLASKGTLDPGKDVDVLVLRRDSLGIVEVIPVEDGWLLEAGLT